jgi:hypothetical protein
VKVLAETYPDCFKISELGPKNTRPIRFYFSIITQTLNLKFKIVLSFGLNLFKLFKSNEIKTSNLKSGLKILTNFYNALGL